MARLKNEDIFYSLNIGDIQNVAQQELGRDLTESEIGRMMDSIVSKVNWYDAIADTITESELQE